MFEMLMWLYDGGKGKLNRSMLTNAVIMKWITEEQKQEILSTKIKKE